MQGTEASKKTPYDTQAPAEALQEKVGSLCIRTFVMVLAQPVVMLLCLSLLEGFNENKRKEGYQLGGTIPARRHEWLCRFYF